MTCPPELGEGFKAAIGLGVRVEMAVALGEAEGDAVTLSITTMLGL